MHLEDFYKLRKIFTIQVLFDCSHCSLNQALKELTSSQEFLHCVYLWNLQLFRFWFCFKAP